jgi:hypothetical protein
VPCTPGQAVAGGVAHGAPNLVFLQAEAARGQVAGARAPALARATAVDRARGAGPRATERSRAANGRARRTGARAPGKGRSGSSGLCAARTEATCLATTPTSPASELVAQRVPAAACRQRQIERGRRGRKSGVGGKGGARFADRNAKGRRRQGFGAMVKEVGGEWERKRACGNSEPGRRYQARCQNLARAVGTWLDARGLIAWIGRPKSECPKR